MRLFYSIVFLMIAVLCGPGYILHAQYEQVWIFGLKAGLDFHSSIPKPLLSSIDGGFGESTASVCDGDGKLLFYTEGTTVWNSDGIVMTNGANLLPIESAVYGVSPTSSSTQGVIIVPQPGSESRYYVFSLTSFEQLPVNNYGRLYYSVVDMSLNNGRGEVDTAERGILLHTGLQEKMTSVLGDRCNIWLLVHSYKNEFKAFSVSASGIDTIPQISQVGKTGTGLAYSGQMVVSPDRRKLVTCYQSFVSRSGAAELFDFDPATGLVSNGVSLDTVIDYCYYGAAFSPDNSKLYTAAALRGEYAIYQFDVNASMPSNTKTLVSYGQHTFSQLKLAPNGKIYCRFNDNALSVINYPNLIGAACQFVPQAVSLLPGTTMRAGFPNVVSYVVKTDVARSSKETDAPCWFNGLEGYRVTANPEGWDYYWDDSSSQKQRVVFKPGRYWVSYYTAPCQLHVDTFVFKAPNGTLPHISIDNSCFNRNTGKAWAHTYPEDTVRYYYTWRNQNMDTLSLIDTLSHVAAGKYNVEIKTANCDTVLFFEVPELTDRVAFAGDTLVCVQDTVLLNNLSGNYYQFFNWSVDGQFLSNKIDTGYIAAIPGRHQIMLVGQGKVCSDTAYLSITVDNRLNTHFLISDDSLCVGQSVQFRIQERDTTIISYLWNFNQAVFSHRLAEYSFSHAFDKSGYSTISLLTKFRVCPERLFSDTVFVEALPVINLGADSFLCLHGNAIMLENQNKSIPLRYLWNNGATSASIVASHPGWYKLTAYTLGLGCVSSEEIEVRKDCYIDIPNSFTPNGDSYNDFFFPRSLLSRGVHEFSIQIFNRWGQLIFETRSIEGRGWDGKWNGQDQPIGVYVYRIEVLVGDQKEAYMGNVTLLR